MKTISMLLTLLAFPGAAVSLAATTATPVIFPATGTYAMPRITTITDSSFRSSIKWCHVTSGTCTPNAYYTGSISVYPSTTETICAFATASGHTQSSTVCNSYTTAQTSSPAISLASGAYAMPKGTTITDSTARSSIKWCQITSGTCTPNASYKGSISVNPSSTETLCAYATASGYAQSSTVCNSYTTAQTATPAISLAGGTYAMPISTAITDLTSGSSIEWCNVNLGTCTPNVSYTGSIPVDPSSTETLCAYATASGYTQSSTVCNSYTTAQAATPAIGLGSGTYAMPKSTTITDSTSGSSIEWCYATSGACTPKAAYTGSIYVNPKATETICAYATASGYAQSSTVCNYYDAEASAISFSYANGQVTMSTTLDGASIFYTLDGSTATEASIEYIPGNPVTVADGVTINAVAVQMTNGIATGVAVQNGQLTASNWKTVLASSSTQSSTYLSSYNTPDIQYGSGNGSCNHGVCGIPSQVGMVVNQLLPSAIGAGATANFSMTTENLSGAGSGLQILWPYNDPDGTSGGCDSCTSMIQDFYIWPQFTGTGPSDVNPANVENWELDMNSWNVSIPTYGYLGASFQCSILEGGWQYNGQYAPGWTNLELHGLLVNDQDQPRLPVPLRHTVLGDPLYDTAKFHGDSKRDRLRDSCDG